MKLRPPAYPLLTIDPYISIWSMHDTLTAQDTRQWTGRSNILTGIVSIDGKEYVFMGDAARAGRPAMEQKSVDLDAFSTVYTFAAGGVELTARFTSPLLPDDMLLLSRPVSYLHVQIRSLDGASHTALLTVRVSGQICVDRDDPYPLVFEQVTAADGVATMKMGGLEQPVLGRSGDGVGIDWGYVYLSADGDSRCGCRADAEPAYIYTETALDTARRPAALIAFAYDDVYALTYFGRPLEAYWKKDGATIENAIADAYREYPLLLERCAAFDKAMTAAAAAAGGEEYAELLQLALRQVLAAHKLALDEDGEVLYISKECYSNGCAATVDVSYPSIPLFLLYNPELVKGMLRPIFRYAASSAWPFPYAPHDVGTYPILNGQVYSRGTDPRWQMPVEECGNMLVMVSAVTAAEGNAAFAEAFRPLLDTWADYLAAHGLDPENQLCTDDFAGHLAHNCNLSLKAIVGLGGYAEVCRRLGDDRAADRYGATAKAMAAAWLEKAANGDGSYRLAFDRPGTFSMKYNAVWDRLLGLGLFPEDFFRTETAGYRTRVNPYGLPLDNRADYTKSDWLVWTATLAGDKADFEEMVHPLWLAYHLSPSRVPMTDWYSTVTSLQAGFQHRTVQGGLWIKLLDAEKICRVCGHAAGGGEAVPLEAVSAP